MRLLIVGGTSFVGRHITERALSAGHQVTLFNRGRTNAGAFEGAELVRGDRAEGPVGLQALAGRQFDATIDVCGYVPVRVRELLSVLDSGAGRYTFISSISVYPEDSVPGFDEFSPLLAPSYSDELTIPEYGALKVGCELTATEILGPERVCLVRPGYVVGPYDPTGRFTYWVERVARAGAEGVTAMLGPAAEQPLQVIDGRDLGALVVGLVEQGASGPFNAAAPDPAFRFDEAVAEIASGLGVAMPEVVWRGPHEQLPLTDPPDSWGLMQADTTKACSHGLSWRPLAETARDLLEWVTQARADGTYVDRGGVMSPETEAQLLTQEGSW